MSRVPETTATMIHIAAERGVTHARLNLKPVELGGIEVRLRTTPQGIEAKLVADSPEAAKLLQTAAADLRRDLEARDVNLLSLDVSTQSEQQSNPQAQFGDEFGDAQGFGFAGGRRRNGSTDDAGLTETAASAETTLVLPNGVLVDVLA
jgi:flagellar hook-length control protein FliK